MASIGAEIVAFIVEVVEVVECVAALIARRRTNPDGASVLARQISMVSASPTLAAAGSTLTIG